MNRTRPQVDQTLGRDASTPKSSGFGFELADDPQVRVTYGELAARDVAWQVPDEDLPLKPASAKSVSVVTRNKVARDADRACPGKRSEGNRLPSQVQPWAAKIIITGSGTRK